MCVDIIIPVHNRDQLAKRSIHSVLSQSYPKWNLYIVDDASDRTILSNDITTLDNRIHLLRLKNNRGPAYARNFASRMGTAEYIAFLDSDDYWHKDKLMKQILFLKEHIEYNWVHTNELWIRNKKTVKQKARHRKKGGQFLVESFKRCLISPSAVLFRRDFFLRNGGFQNSFRVAEDFEAWLRMNYSAPIGYIDEPLTIKTSGLWPQLSSAPEIDRQRVLALHRFYRLHKKEENFHTFRDGLFDEIEYKMNILLKGAYKYNKKAKVMEYHNWLRVFKRARTKFD